MKNGFIILFLLATGCTYKYTLFDYTSTSTNMYQWSVCDSGKGGLTFTLYHTYDDSLKRHYFVTYSTISDFVNDTFSYHVSSVNYHKDSVNLEKLHRIENYNESEKLLVKQNRKGYFTISSAWDNTHYIKIKSPHPARARMLYGWGEAVSPLSGIDFIPGKVETHSQEFKNALLLGNYSSYQLGIANDSVYGVSQRYFEYTFMFDSVAYVFNGFRLTTGEMTFTRLKKLTSDLPSRMGPIAHTVETTGVSESKKPGVSYPTVIKISTENGFVLTTSLSPVNQEIRSMKWGAWVGFSTCNIYYKPDLNGVARNPKTGCLKLIIL